MLMFEKNSRILVLAPHTDDGEMGCGGTINKLVEAGHEVYYVAFSSCSESLAKGLAPDTLIHEAGNATALLGIKPENLLIHDIPVRYFSEQRQKILECLVSLKKDIQPTVIFAPSTHDIHQDHATIANEAIRAFKSSTIFAYEIVWNNLIFENRCYIEISEHNLAKKVEAIHAYKSQQLRSYMTEEFVRSLANVRGVSIQKRYAEMFDVVRMVM